MQEKLFRLLNAPFPILCLNSGTGELCVVQRAGLEQARAVTGITKKLPWSGHLELLAARQVKSKEKSLNCRVRNQGWI